jgi:hypothetical protein
MSLLKGFSSFSSSTPINDIQENIISFFDYGLVEKSGFVNVSRSNSGVYGGLDYRLRPVEDPRYSDGQVWQAVKGNWVWESGNGATTSNNPAYPGVSGIYVNSTFYPRSTTGQYAHYVDHRNGRVVFNSAISTTASVECNYSYKYVNVVKCNGLQWFLNLQKYSDRSDRTNFISQSGEYDFLAENRIQMPVIGIEMTNGSNLSPYQLGGGQYIKLNIMAHCIAEDGYIRDKLVDIIVMQKEKSFYMYDLDSIANNEAFPLDYRGVPVSGALRYPDLVDTYKGRILRILDCSIDSIYNLTPQIHVGTVKITTEFIHFGV